MKQRTELLRLLDEAWAIPSLKHCLLWPTVVAGYETARGDIKERVYVDEFLFTMGKQLSGAYPFVARSMLRTFWSTGKRDWDDCFDRPSVFVW